MAHVFLSEEWFAAVEALRAEYEGRLPDPPTDAVANVTVTGVPFDADRMHLHVDAAQGRLAVGRTHRDDAELTITTDYGTAQALILESDQPTGVQALTRAFFEGRITLQGDLTRFMALQEQVGQPDEVTAELARRVREITAPTPA